jgi:competence protein ComEC
MVGSGSEAPDRPPLDEQGSRGHSGQPGRALTALSVSAVAAIVVGNLAPPAAHLWPILAGAASLAGACGLHGRRWIGWWIACGALAGAAACAWAPHGLGRSHTPVRFVAAVRDPWTAGNFGWTARVRLLALSFRGKPLARPPEVFLTVGGSALGRDLPSPGTRMEGSGELDFDPELPLRRPRLWVKTPLLLRSVPGTATTDLLRERAARALQRAAGVRPCLQRAAALAAALALGRTGGLPPGEVDALRRSGLAHLLAVSGLHVGLVATLVWGLLLAASVPPGPRRWGVAAALVGFCLLAGGRAPVRRAATGGVAYLLARQAGRPLDPLPAVWAIVAGLLLFEPDAVLQAGFQLSAVVTLALVRWVGPLAARLSFLPRRLAQLAAVSVVAQAASAPLVGAHFGAVPALATAVNLAAAPLAFVLTALSLASLAACWLALGAGRLVLYAVVAVQHVLDLLAAAGSGLAWPFPQLPALLVAALLCLAVWALMRARGAAIAAAMVVLLAVGWMALPGRSLRGRGEITMLGVREGMALLVRSSATTILVDTGRGWDESRRALSALRVKRLDALVLTHGDADHIGGARSLLERLNVGILAFPERSGATTAVVELRRIARARGARELPLSQGQRWQIGEILLDVLWPPRSYAGSDNDGSLVAAFRMAGRRLLVTGDIEAGGEARLLDSGLPLRAAILQLPHHGSRTSSTAAFLAAVHPAIAMAASGTRPRFVYPAPEVAERVRHLPALVVAQTAGLERVWWRDPGEIRIGAPETVTLPLTEEFGGD